MEMVSSIVKDQLNRFIIEMGDFAMKKKTIIISGMAAVLVIGSVVFCFAVKGDGTQPAEVAQTVTEAVATPSIEVTQETTEETSSEVSEPEEVPEVEVAEEPEVVEETTEVEETSGEVSIVDVAETTEEDENIGVPTQKEEVSSEQVAEPKQEEVKPAETKPVETQPQQTKTEPNVNQISTDEASQALINQILADGGVLGGNPTNPTLGETAAFNSAALDVIVE